MHSIDLLKHWLVEVDTDPDLRDCMVEYARGQGGITMTELCEEWTTGFVRWQRSRMPLGGGTSWKV